MIIRFPFYVLFVRFVLFCHNMEKGLAVRGGMVWPRLKERISVIVQAKDDDGLD